MKRVAPLLLLAFLSAFTAEFLLGDQYLQPNAALQQVFMVIFYMAFYGTGAILIREFGRRAGVGWPGMLIMAFGFGVFEEGLITQSLFNRHYLGLDLLAPGFVPTLGIGLQWTVFVITLHVVWSISTPVALFEALFGSAPRLRRIGLVVTGVIFVLAATATFAFTYLGGGGRFLAGPYQLAAAAVITIVALVVGLRLPRRAATTHQGRLVPSLIVGAVVTTAFQLVGRYLSHVPDWVPTVGMIAVLLAGAVLAARLRLSPTGLALGAVLTYAWVGVRAAAGAAPPANVTDLIEQSVIVLGYLALLVLVLARTVSRNTRLRGQQGAVAQPVRAEDS